MLLTLGATVGLRISISRHRRQRIPGAGYEQVVSFAREEPEKTCGDFRVGGTGIHPHPANVDIDIGEPPVRGFDRRQLHGFEFAQ